MKLLRKVDDNYITYVQLRDLDALIKLEVTVPKSVRVVLDVYEDSNILLDKRSFIFFPGEGTQTFFNSEYTNWILDLDECVNMSEHDFYIKTYELRNIITNMERKRYETCGLTDSEIDKQYHMLKYRFDTLKDISDIRLGRYECALPCKLKGDRGFELDR